MFLKKKPKLLYLQEIKGDQSSDKIQQLIQTAQHLILKLHHQAKAQFIIVNNEMIVELPNGIKVYTECEEDLFIINEVFNELCYGTHLSGDYMLLDVGLNIGISALFFNSLPQIKQIYAFEPVLDTYQKCLRNLQLNNAGLKIKTFNYGLGNSDRDEEFIFSENFKGSVGSIGLSDYKKNNSQQLKNVKVSIREASTVFDELMKLNPAQKLLAKLDCEGAEHEIIPNLKESGILDKISVILMEWHNIEFLNILNHFDSFNYFYHKNSETTGMLFAVNKSI